MNADLANFEKWCTQNKLTINVKKNKYVVFGLKSQIKNIGNPIVSIDNTPLDRVSSYK